MIISRKDKVINSKESLGISRKIKEPKIKIENFNIIKELENQHESYMLNDIDIHAKQLIVEDTSTRVPEGSKSVWNIFADEGSILSRAFEKKIKDMSAKEKNALAALMIRLKRFRLKFYIVKKLHDRSIVSLSAIDKKLNTLIQELKKKKVIIDLEKRQQD